MEAVVRGLLFLFLLYTVLYIFQWLLGLTAATIRLSRLKKRISLVPQYPAPPVTVLVPACNEEACILSTLQGLLDCGYPDLEIIVIDDGSSDRTAEILRTAFHMEPKRIPREGKFTTAPILGCYHAPGILLISKERKGKADALNCGLNLCRTDLCLVLDADTHPVPDSIQLLVSRFLEDPKTIVCAGAVGTEPVLYPRLKFFQKALVLFQALEYSRTFYMQRILLDQCNGNLVVSGAFALFDTGVLRSCGGYRGDTIGEDMELTMRLHSFCRNQGMAYRIRYEPAARCVTQFPFRWRDYYRQRRRWQIGMMQCLRKHRKMLWNLHYGWAGLLSGLSYGLYELWSPFLEIIGLATLAAASRLEILDKAFAAEAISVYFFLLLLTQAVLIHALGALGITPITMRQRMALTAAGVGEFLVYHLLSTVTRLLAFFSFHRRSRTWGKILRYAEVSSI